jgi:hypothetical protein
VVQLVLGDPFLAIRFGVRRLGRDRLVEVRQRARPLAAILQQQAEPQVQKPIARRRLQCGAVRADRSASGRPRGSRSPPSSDTPRCRPATSAAPAAPSGPDCPAGSAPAIR